MGDWYYVTGGRQAGPVSQEEMRQKVRSGEVDADTYVWTSGMGDWEPARDQHWYQPPARDGGLQPAPGAQAPPPPGSQPGGSPSELSSTTRNWAMAAHLSALVGALFGVGFLVFVGPLVVWLVKREEHPFIAGHAREALNFNISVLIYAVVCLLLALVLIGIPLLVALFVFWLVVTIMASVRAANGQDYRYPLTIRFVRG